MSKVPNYVNKHFLRKNKTKKTQWDPFNEKIDGETWHVTIYLVSTDSEKTSHL